MCESSSAPCQSVCHFLGFGEHAYAVPNNLLDTGRKLYLDLDYDFQELLQYHTQKLITEDILELKSLKLEDKVTEEAQEPAQPKRFHIKQLAEGFSMDDYELPWLKLRIQTIKISYGVRSHSQAIVCYKLTYKEKKTATWEDNAEIKKQDGRHHTELILLSTEQAAGCCKHDNKLVVSTETGNFSTI